MLGITNRAECGQLSTSQFSGPGARRPQLALYFKYMFSYHICTYRGGKQRTLSGRHDSPHIRKSSLDHDSGENNRGCQSYFQTYTTLVVFTSVIRASLCTTPPRVLGPPPMDLGRFEISKGPSNRGGLDLGLFEKSNRPSRRGDLDFGLFRKSNRPSKRVEIP